MVMITITNYANNYANTTYQSLEGAKKKKKKNSWVHQITETPSHPPQKRNG